MSHFLKERQKELTFTEELPDKPGFYWWTNFGEHTPCVLGVKMDYSSKRLYASNGEYEFFITPKDEMTQAELFKEEEEEENLKDGYKYDTEMWCYIPCPMLPNGKQPTPDCY